MQHRDPLTSAPRYARLEPSPPLRPYVESHWVQEASIEPDAAPTIVLPTGNPELVIYFGDPFCCETGSRWSEHSRAVFGGQRTMAFRASATGRTGIWIVRFHPWGAGPWLGSRLADLADRFVDLAEVTSPSTANPLAEDLARTPPEGRQGRVEGLLLDRLAGRPVDPLVCRAVGLAGTGDIGYLAERLSVSRRTLTRRFGAAVGLTPKRYGDLMRFQRSLALRRGGASWADAAVEAGYHDQAHLIHAWRRVVAASPQRLLGRRSPSALARFFFGGDGGDGDGGGGTVSQTYNTAYL